MTIEPLYNPQMELTLKRIVTSALEAKAAWRNYYTHVQVLTGEILFTEEQIGMLRKMDNQFIAHLNLAKQWAEQMQDLKPEELDEDAVDRMQYLIDRVLTYKGAYTLFLLNSFAVGKDDTLYGKGVAAIKDRDRLLLRTHNKKFNEMTKDVSIAIEILLVPMHSKNLSRLTSR